MGTSREAQSHLAEKEPNYDAAEQTLEKKKLTA